MRLPFDFRAIIIIKAFGSHPARSLCFGKKRGLTITSAKTDGDRDYRIIDGVED